MFCKARNGILTFGYNQLIEFSMTNTRRVFCCVNTKYFTINTLIDNKGFISCLYTTDSNNLRLNTNGLNKTYKHVKVKTISHDTNTIMSPECLVTIRNHEDRLMEIKVEYNKKQIQAIIKTHEGLEFSIIDDLSTLFFSHNECVIKKKHSKISYEIKTEDDTLFVTRKSPSLRKIVFGCL